MTVIHNSLSLLTGAIAPILILTNVQAIAQSTTETDRSFSWAVVPDAMGYTQPGNPHSPMEPWYINTDPIIRRGDLVTFEAASPTAEYVQFLGNCQTWQITPQYIGEFLDNDSIRYQFAQGDWQYATGWRSALLDAACNPHYL
jgi:hypothetical protein